MYSNWLRNIRNERISEEEGQWRRTIGYGIFAASSPLDGRASRDFPIWAHPGSAVFPRVPDTLHRILPHELGTTRSSTSPYPKYWEDVEEVIEACGKTTDDNKITVTSRYIDREDELLWKGYLPKDGTPISWTAYKKEVEKLYPGADGHKIFTASDLESFISVRAGMKIELKDHLSTYHRKFRTIPNHSIAEGKITELETRRDFPKGMDDEFRNRVYRPLRITRPDHPSDTLYKVKDMVDAGQYILEGPHAMAGEAADSVAIKQEILDLRESLAKMGQQYHPSSQPGPYVGPYGGRDNGYAPRDNYRRDDYLPQDAYAQWDSRYPPRKPWPARESRLGTMFPPGECGFCSDTGHFMRECPVVQDYEHAGKCFQNANRRIVLPNGQYIPRVVVGRNLAKRIDRWIAQNPLPAQTQPNPQQHQQVLEWAQPLHPVAAISYTTTSKVAQTIRKPKKLRTRKAGSGSRPVPEVVIERTGQPRQTAGTAAATQPLAAAKTVSAAPARPTIKPPTGPLNIKSTAKNTVPALPQLPALKYQAPIENPASRIPTVETTAFQEHKEALMMSYGAMTSTFLLTASPIDSLHGIEMLVNNTHRVMCALDQGSEIVAMNRNIWKMIGVPLSPEKVLTMESADSNQSITPGVVENLKFTVRDMELFLQVHVVDGAPFNILVSRSFFRFTECHMKYYADGPQELTLTCPTWGRYRP
ncbi:hypothetical protein B0H19DRAFT_1086006 [Mycena capillaripes]|nr:hypothetical protein B0H19DRAFT_1086006 [Mycena capillaripes]